MHMTANPAGPAVTWKQMLIIVNSDVRRRATTYDHAWLRRSENLLNWLMVSRHLRRRVERRIAQERLNLAEARPKNATGPVPPEYLLLKAEFDVRARDRLYFLSLIDESIEEAKFLLGNRAIAAIGSVDYIERLTVLRCMLMSNDDPTESLIAVVDSLIRDLADLQPAKEWNP
jgi:hypothetical protein